MLSQCSRGPIDILWIVFAVFLCRSVIKCYERGRVTLRLHACEFEEVVRRLEENTRS